MSSIFDHVVEAALILFPVPVGVVETALIVSLGVRRLLQEDVLQFCELLFVSLTIMPPSKVCLQCKAMVPLRLKVCISCQHVFRAKRRAEHSLAAKAMKRARVLQSDSVKSVTKAKDKLQKASKRASESSEQTLHRQEQDRERKGSMRASETGEQILHRQEQDRERKGSMRASETGEQTLHRQEQDRERKASMRASETGEQTLHRQEHSISS